VILRISNYHLLQSTLCPLRPPIPHEIDAHGNEFTVATYYVNGNMSSLVKIIENSGYKQNAKAQGRKDARKYSRPDVYSAALRLGDLALISVLIQCHKNIAKNVQRQAHLPCFIEQNQDAHAPLQQVFGVCPGLPLILIAPYLKTCTGPTLR
jgi:hypothetical protein